MIVSGGQSCSSERRSSCFAARSSKIASMTSSTPDTAASNFEVGVMFPSAGSMRSASTRPSDDNRRRLARMFSMARASWSSPWSCSRTWKPASANSWAIPWPMSPAPTTAIRSICEASTPAPLREDISTAPYDPGSASLLASRAGIPLGRSLALPEPCEGIEARPGPDDLDIIRQRSRGSQGSPRPSVPTGARRSPARCRPTASWTLTVGSRSWSKASRNSWVRNVCEPSWPLSWRSGAGRMSVCHHFGC